MESEFSSASRIKRHILKRCPGEVITPAELTQARYGSATAVRKALGRLERAGLIRRIAKGYYERPRTNPLIGEVGPSREAILAAYARKTGAEIRSPNQEAANVLGLTTQVVARPFYRTDVSRRDLKIGGLRIALRPVGPRSIGRQDNPTELVIDALKAIGKNRVDDKHVRRLRRFVMENALVDDLRRRSERAPQWMLPIIDRVIGHSP
jgi:hypothetical protein